MGLCYGKLVGAVVVKRALTRDGGWRGVSQRVWTIAGGDTLEHLSTREQEEEAGGEKEL